MSDFHQEFVRFAIDNHVLTFGEFITKAGRRSPYFFNAGLFNNGAALLNLSRFYAKLILETKIEFDMLFGPAYKGIALAAGTSMALAEQGVNVGFAYNRKEAKDHGEGGVLIGAPLKGKVLIIDDVISAGTSVRESINLIRAAGAEPAGMVIALDRMERGQGTLSATQEIREAYSFPISAIATLDDILTVLETTPQSQTYQTAIQRYRNQYGG